MTEQVYGELRVHPLQWGDTLASHEWVELHLHRLLTSRFVARSVAGGRREDIASAMFLWCEAFRQDPAGTLPDDDVQLARLAMYGSDICAWQAVRENVLWGWYPVEVDGEATDNVPRLGHRLIGEIAERMLRRKTSRDQGRKAGAVAQQRTRIRRMLTKLGYKNLARQDDPVERVRAFLADGGLWITEDNLRAALEYIGAPRLVRPEFSNREG